MVRVDMTVLLYFAGPDCPTCGCALLLQNEKTAELTENNPVMGLQSNTNGDCMFKGIWYCPECNDESDGVAVLSKAWLLG